MTTPRTFITPLPTHPTRTPEDTTTTPEPLTKLLYRVPEAMEILSMPRSTLYELIRSGQLRSVKQGSTRLIPARALADYVATLEAAALKEAC